jgi:glycosyltransferase A (GT-A) superfamily protein (DUF2064 family)
VKVLAAQVLVIAKAPVPGRVKTRLTPPFSPVQAARLAEAALADTLAAVARVPAARHVLALDGAPGRWLPTGFDVIGQHATGLDQRIATAFSEAYARLPLPVVLIGMDTPQVTPELLESAIRPLLSDAADPGCAAAGALGPLLSDAAADPSAAGARGARGAAGAGPSAVGAQGTTAFYPCRAGGAADPGATAFYPCRARGTADPGTTAPCACRARGTGGAGATGPGVPGRARDVPVADATLGLADDGGFWLLGLRRPDPRLVTGVPMSTPHTGAAQLARLAGAGLRVRQLPCCTDVDTVADAVTVARQIPRSRFAATLRALQPRPEPASSLTAQTVSASAPAG